MKTIEVSKICSDLKCRRVAVVARKCGDMWVSRCAFHENKTISMDFDKILTEKKGR